MKRILMVVAASFMAMILAACGGESGQKKEEGEAKAAMEQAQDKMDEAKDKVEEAKDKVDDKMNDQKPAAQPEATPAENTTTQY